MEEKKKKSKLKIIIPIAIIVIAVVIGIIVVASKNNNTNILGLSNEQMIEKAEDLTLKKFNETLESSSVKAKEHYVGNIYKITDYITDINDDYIIFTKDNTKFKIYLPHEEIAKLTKNKKVTIVGKLDNINYESKANPINVEVKNAFVTKLSLEDIVRKKVDFDVILYLGVGLRLNITNTNVDFTNIDIDSDTLKAIVSGNVSGIVNGKNVTYPFDGEYKILEDSEDVLRIHLQVGI